MANVDSVAAQRANKGSRRRSRELALQALYQWLLSGDDADVLCRQTAEKKDYARADVAYLETIVRGAVGSAEMLGEAVQPFLDRPVAQLSPIERALLLIGAYELLHSPEVPYKVVINEAVELAKSYGGTDGHKYVNGVLDKLAAQARSEETRKA